MTLSQSCFSVSDKIVLVPNYCTRSLHIYLLTIDLFIIIDLFSQSHRLMIKIIYRIDRFIDLFITIDLSSARKLMACDSSLEKLE